MQHSELGQDTFYGEQAKLLLMIVGSGVTMAKMLWWNLNFNQCEPHFCRITINCFNFPTWQSEGVVCAIFKFRNEVGAMKVMPAHFLIIAATGNPPVDSASPGFSASSSISGPGSKGACDKGMLILTFLRVSFGEMMLHASIVRCWDWEDFQIWEYTLAEFESQLLLNVCIWHTWLIVSFMLLSDKANKFEITWFCFLKVEGHSFHAVNFPCRVIADTIESEFKRTEPIKTKWPPGQKSRVGLTHDGKGLF